MMITLVMSLLDSTLFHLNVCRQVEIIFLIFNQLNQILIISFLLGDRSYISNVKSIAFLASKHREKIIIDQEEGIIKAIRGWCFSFQFSCLVLLKK